MEERVVGVPYSAIFTENPTGVNHKERRRELNQGKFISPHICMDVTINIHYTK